MARALSSLGLLISFALTGFALTTSPVGAADRYGPGDQGDYTGPDNGYAQGRYQPRDEREAVDPYAMHDRVMRRDSRAGERDFDRSDRADGDARGYQRSGESRVVRRFSDGDEREAVDPYARHDRVIRQQRWSDDGGYDRSSRTFDEDRDYARSRILHDGGAAWGYADRGYVGQGYADRDYAGQGYVEGYADRRGEVFEGEGYGPVARVYADGDVWRTREAYVSGPVYDARGEGYVDACAIAHARIGERCPFAQEGRRVFREDRAFVQDEQLPEDFFISEGGVGPGIVDFGGGGGGGGGFAFADSASNAESNASASAMASASAKVSVRVAVMAHNHQMMMHHYPSHPMGHGCGCKK